MDHVTERQLRDDLQIEKDRNVKLYQELESLEKKKKDLEEKLASSKRELLETRQELEELKRRYSGKRRKSQAALERYERAVQMFRNGSSLSAVAQALGVSVRAVSRYRAQYKAKLAEQSDQ